MRCEKCLRIINNENVYTSVGADGKETLIVECRQPNCGHVEKISNLQKQMSVFAFKPKQEAPLFC